MAMEEQGIKKAKAVYSQYIFKGTLIIMMLLRKKTVFGRPAFPECSRLCELMKWIWLTYFEIFHCSWTFHFSALKHQCFATGEDTGVCDWLVRDKDHISGYRNGIMWAWWEWWLDVRNLYSVLIHWHHLNTTAIRKLVLLDLLGCEAHDVWWVQIFPSLVQRHGIIWHKGGRAI